MLEAGFWDNTWAFKIVRDVRKPVVINWRYSRTKLILYFTVFTLLGYQRRDMSPSV